ncbi:uncharacterized protein PHA67_004175 [Liasis olivaceus]
MFHVKRKGSKLKAAIYSANVPPFRSPLGSQTPPPPSHRTPPAPAGQAEVRASPAPARRPLSPSRTPAAKRSTAREAWPSHLGRLWERASARGARAPAKVSRRAGEKSSPAGLQDGRAPASPAPTRGASPIQVSPAPQTRVPGLRALTEPRRGGFLAVSPRDGKPGEELRLGHPRGAAAGGKWLLAAPGTPALSGCSLPPRRASQRASEPAGGRPLLQRRAPASRGRGEDRERREGSQSNWRRQRAPCFSRSGGDGKGVHGRPLPGGGMNAGSPRGSTAHRDCKVVRTDLPLDGSEEIWKTSHGFAAIQRALRWLQLGLLWV